MPESIRITPVHSRRELKLFLSLPWKIYQDDPAWVPPLLYELKVRLCPRRHPFHRHAEVQYFLAWLGQEVVGRVAAIVNHSYTEFHREAAGFLGFFESAPHEAVARELFGAAERWLAERGVQRVLGPMSFSTNEECGLLVEGFGSPPALMMPYNPPYYAQLFEAAGYTKAKDLLAYRIESSDPPRRLLEGTRRLKLAREVSIRPINLRRFQEEVSLIGEIYNSAWEKNWGFVPLTEAEALYLALQFRRLADPHLCLIAEVRDNPVGFALALPDYNQVLRYLNGRLWPLGFLKLLWYRRRIRAARVLTLGLRPGFRHTGMDALLYLRLWEEARRKGYGEVECSWVLEDNWAMRRALERMGALRHKTYRIYEKSL